MLQAALAHHHESLVDLHVASILDDEQALSVGSLSGFHDFPALRKLDMELDALFDAGDPAAALLSLLPPALEYLELGLSELDAQHEARRTACCRTITDAVLAGNLKILFVASYDLRDFDKPGRELEAACAKKGTDLTLEEFGAHMW
jgi:hypothetical protein